MKGIINPKGRQDLNETTRNLTPRYWSSSDKEIGLKNGTTLSPWIRKAADNSFKERRVFLSGGNTLMFLYKVSKKKKISASLRIKGIIELLSEFKNIKIFNHYINKVMIHYSKNGEEPSMNGLRGLL